MAAKPSKRKASFRSWLFVQRKRDDMVGDIARDVFADTSKPDFAKLEEWRRHVGDYATPALEAAWKEYRA